MLLKYNIIHIIFIITLILNPTTCQEYSQDFEIIIDHNNSSSIEHSSKHFHIPDYIFKPPPKSILLASSMSSISEPEQVCFIWDRNPFGNLLIDVDDWSLSVPAPNGPVLQEEEDPVVLDNSAWFPPQDIDVWLLSVPADPAFNPIRQNKFRSFLIATPPKNFWELNGFRRTPQTFRPYKVQIYPRV